MWRNQMISTAIATKPDTAIAVATRATWPGTLSSRPPAAPAAAALATAPAGVASAALARAPVALGAVARAAVPRAGGAVPPDLAAAPPGADAFEARAARRRAPAAAIRLSAT